jgi:hypothetical protein
VLSITLATITVHAGRISAKKQKMAMKVQMDGGRSYTAPGNVDWAEGQYVPIGSQKDLRTTAQEVTSEAEAKNPFNKILWWGFVYFPGAITGFVGIMDLVRQYFTSTPQLQTISFVFLGVAGGCTLMIFMFVFITKWDGKNFVSSIFGSVYVGIVWAFVILTILTALYTDWALGAIDGDLAGNPTDNNEVLYFLYWAAKRLPMISL